MSIWLPLLATDRVKRAPDAPADHHPLALYAKCGNRFTLSACDERAVRAGLRAGMALADARAICPALSVREAEPNEDARLLDQVAAWCERFTPIVVCNLPDSLFLDITGCAHLVGGEAALLEAVQTGLKKCGFAARAAIAPNPGAAWALAHFGVAAIAHEKTLRTALAPLPIAALRLAPEAIALLKRLGLQTIGQILHAPRAPFAARAGQNAMLRLDQALGRAVEALSPRRPPPPFFALRRLVEPALTLDVILVVIQDLCDDLCRQLDAAGHGARRLRVSLFGLEDVTRTLELGLTVPERSARPMQRLLRERLQVISETLDAEFGFDALRLDALEASPIIMRETDLAQDEIRRDEEAQARLLDRLRARLGETCVGELSVRATHAPERASAWASKNSAPSTIQTPQDGVMRRPLTLFPRAQPIEAIAELPDGPPAQFRWRRVTRKIVRAEGPERIAPNWLRAPHARARDYYRVEDADGRRYWLYREGYYGEGQCPRWFLHGLFA